MPTAGRAAAAILFAILALAIASVAASGLPTAVPPGPAILTAAGFGLLTGWRMGGERRVGATASAARGLTTAVAAAFWTLLFGALWLMVRRALRGQYDNPTEALGDVAALMLDLGRALMDPVAVVILIAGGALAGIAAGAVARRLP